MFSLEATFTAPGIEWRGFCFAPATAAGEDFVFPDAGELDRVKDVAVAGALADAGEVPGAGGKARGGDIAGVGALAGAGEVPSGIVRVGRIAGVGAVAGGVEVAGAWFRIFDGL